MVHVGFCGTDDCAQIQRPIGLWLHDGLAAKARELVGIDIDPVGVERATAEGFEAYAADCCDASALQSIGLPKAELIIAGEVIEHVDAPGAFLDAMHVLGNKLIVTTPNATSLLKFAAALTRREVINPDTVTLYSWFTLTNVLARHGWRVETIHTSNYPQQPFQGRVLDSRIKRLAARGFLWIQRFLAKSWNPFLAHGLVAVCEADTFRVRRAKTGWDNEF